MKKFVKWIALASVSIAMLAGCSGERVKNQAKEAAARYWAGKSLSRQGCRCAGY